MGCYIKPHDCDKVDWLETNGTRTSGPTEITESHVPICLVDNGVFKAAAVGFSAREIEIINEPTDFRPKCWYTAKRSLVRTVSDLYNYEIQS